MFGAKLARHVPRNACILFMVNLCIYVWYVVCATNEEPLNIHKLDIKIVRRKGQSHKYAWQFILLKNKADCIALCCSLRSWLVWDHVQTHLLFIFIHADVYSELPVCIRVWRCVCVCVWRSKVKFLINPTKNMHRIDYVVIILKSCFYNILSVLKSARHTQTNVEYAYAG